VKLVGSEEGVFQLLPYLEGNELMHLKSQTTFLPLRNQLYVR
jgi:hypothetical protein